MIADSRIWFMNEDTYGWAAAYANTCYAFCVPQRRVPQNSRHISGSNVAFADGRVEYVHATRFCSELNREHFDPRH